MNLERGIMITDGGPHPADKWANQSADKIGDLIQINDSSQSAEAVAARKAKPRFVLDLADRLEKHHDMHIGHAKGQLEKYGDERLNHPYDPHPEILRNAADDVADAARGTPFEEHFQKPEVRSVVEGILGSHFASSDHIERSWHVDRKHANGEHSAESRAFKARWHS